MIQNHLSYTLVSTTLTDVTLLADRGAKMERTVGLWVQADERSCEADPLLHAPEQPVLEGG
jgi:hypothetical protein